MVIRRALLLLAIVIVASLLMFATLGKHGGTPRPPVLGVVLDTVTVDEGQIAVNSGTISDAGDTATASASVGTWGWSFATTDGPDDSQTVTITTNPSTGAAVDDTFELLVNNVAPSVAADNGTVTVDEGDTAGNTGTFSDPGLDIVTITATVVGSVSQTGTQNGTWSWSFGTNDGPDQTQTVTITATDSDGDATSTTFALVVNNVDPVLDTGDPTCAPLVVEVNTAVSCSGSFTDAGTADTHNVAATEWDWGDSFTETGTVTEAGGTGSVDNSHSYATPGVYAIELTVADDDGGSDTEVFEFVVVYDPNAGFVTGSGWIDSPAEADRDNLTAIGKANFGFVSKYPRGATTPTGNTEFQFKAGDLNFHSTSYDWLVVAGAKAMFKGEGTINGVGGYYLQLSAIDADIDPSDSFVDDTFRIQIWGAGGLRYDNQVGETNPNADPTTTLGRGSIEIHNN